MGDELPRTASAIFKPIEHEDYARQTDDSKEYPVEHLRHGTLLYPSCTGRQKDGRGLIFQPLSSRPVQPWPLFATVQRIPSRVTVSDPGFAPRNSSAVQALV